MKTAQEHLNESLNRLKTTVELGKPDRVPVVLFADAFCAKHMGVKMSEFNNNPELATKTMIQSLMSLGDFDGSEMLTAPSHMLSVINLSPVKMAGRELPEGAACQLDEYGTMTTEDYDTILNKGFQPVMIDILANRMPDKELPMKIQGIVDYLPQAAQSWADNGIVPFCPILTVPAYDMLVGGRTLPGLTKDLFKMPDKVEAVLKIIEDETIENYRQAIRAVKPFGVFLGTSRGASEFVSPKIFERFVWPSTKKLAEAIVEEGVVCYLHADSNWERDLDHFLDLPKGKCVISSDSATNIYKMREKLGGHMCLMGDVPAALLFLGTPDEVYKHCTKLINEIGPSEYILAQSCTIPINAKPENVAALMAAAAGK
jgi:hypothetical protein